MSLLRNFVFTWNNYCDSDIEFIKENVEYRYLVIGCEVGEQGTPHLQGYIELSKRYRFNTIKKLFPKMHIEARKGSSKQAADYCKKEGNFIEEGTISNPGQRTDIANVYQMAKEGKSDIDIGDAYPDIYMKFYKAVDRVRFNHASQCTKFEPVEVHVFWGEAGCGKTRLAYESDPNLYRVSVENNAIWFDGYHGQKTILLDDFYGGIKYSYLLELLDGYKFKLPVKGSYTWKQWTTVYITSNKAPDEWYLSKGLTPALKRRLTSVTHLTVPV